MSSLADVTHGLDFFTYPRLVCNRAIGYDFGCFVAGQYWVLGNAATQEAAVEAIQSRYHPLSITHEPQSSHSKHKHTRGYGVSAA